MICEDIGLGRTPGLTPSAVKPTSHSCLHTTDILHVTTDILQFRNRVWTLSRQCSVTLSFWTHKSSMVYFSSLF